MVVAGAGVSGAAAARALRDRHAAVTVVEADDERAEVLRAEGFLVLDGQQVREPPPGTSLVVTSPGWRPASPLLISAAAKGIEVIGEVELAWRLRAPGAAPWLAVTGTNGKTTTVTLLEAMLRAAGLSTAAVGNIGRPLVEAVTGCYEVLAVELSSFQLHWVSTVAVHAGALLNLADDHTDWHGSRQAYVADKTRVWGGAHAIGNRDDAQTHRWLKVAPGQHTGFTLGPPGPGEVGIVEHLFVDRAFPDVEGPDAEDGATAVAALADLALPGNHNVANALAATALARAYGLPAEAVRDGLRATVSGAHRNALIVVADEVSWVDDSKATNPHAAAASLAAYPRVVWIAGGLLKGADIEDLVAVSASRLRAVVLLGTDQQQFADALARHAPQVPVVRVSRRDHHAMSEAVRAARAHARAGDTVLLAPAAASMDCFRDYAHRGQAFAAAATQDSS